MELINDYITMLGSGFFALATLGITSASIYYIWFVIFRYNMASTFSSKLLPILILLTIMGLAGAGYTIWFKGLIPAAILRCVGYGLLVPAGILVVRLVRRS